MLTVLWRIARIFVPIFLLISLLCAGLPLRGIANHVAGSGYGNPTNGGSSCTNAGVSYPDNPFWGWPIGGAGWANVTAYYCDPYYMQNFGYGHFGIDLGFPTGTYAYATANATVVRAEYGHPMLGNNVKICTAANWCATYMHFSVIHVLANDPVYAGSLLGEVGSTGNSTGSHLHYEIHDPAGAAVDPAPTLP